MDEVMGRTAGSDAAKSAGKRTENGGRSGRKKGRRSVPDKRRKARASWVMVRRSRTSTTESLMTGLQQPLMEVGEASDEDEKKVADRAASPRFPEKMGNYPSIYCNICRSDGPFTISRIDP